jgi:DNA topoisomerase-3
VDGCKCPVCKEGNVLETQLSFMCSRAAEGCKFTLWKDCLTRGGGPELSAKLVQLVLANQVVRGSTGVIMVDEKQISFFPHGSDAASTRRPLIYVKK